MAHVLDRFVLLNRLPFHYREWGGQGRPLVLLHGLASSAHIWDFVAPLLTTHFWVLALDQRGHGESAKPDEGYDLPTVVGDLAAFVRELALEAPVIVGHSWGASVAVEYAATAPEPPSAIALVDGGVSVGGGQERSWEETWQAMAPPDLTRFTPEEFLRGARQRWAQLRPWTPELEEALMSIFEVTEGGTIRPRFRREHHQQVVRAMWENRQRSPLASLACPVLVMPCRRPAQDEGGRELLRRREEALLHALAPLPKASLRWMEDSIHDVPLQRPELVAGTIIEVLAGL